jgi:hypothetical protein
VAEPVSLRDLPATVFDLLGLVSDDAIPGRSLARLWDTGGEKTAQAPLLMETDKPILLTNQGREPASKGPMKALVAGGMHYIRSGDGSEELYSLNRDPEEQTNLAKLVESQGVLENFRTGLRSILQPRPPSEVQTTGAVEAGTRGK